jgi:hypothetical protein
MEAGRMVVKSFASFLVASFLLLWDNGYQPRHRSSREVGFGFGRLARRRREEPVSARVGRPAGLESPAEKFWMLSPPAEPELLARVQSDRLRGVIEGCALDDLTMIIPEIVQVIARSSANTVTTAWNDFREATRNNPEEDAVVIKLDLAHEALWLITNEPLNYAIGSP